VIAASLFVAAGVGKRRRPVVRGKCGLYGYHTFQYESPDQWITAYRKQSTL